MENENNEISITKQDNQVNIVLKTNKNESSSVMFDKSLVTDTLSTIPYDFVLKGKVDEESGNIVLEDLLSANFDNSEQSLLSSQNGLKLFYNRYLKKSRNLELSDDLPEPFEIKAVVLSKEENSDGTFAYICGVLK